MRKGGRERRRGMRKGKREEGRRKGGTEQFLQS